MWFILKPSFLFVKVNLIILTGVTASQSMFDFLIIPVPRSFSSITLCVENGGVSK